MSSLAEKPDSAHVEGQLVKSENENVYEQAIDRKAERRLLLKLDVVILPLTVLMVGDSQAIGFIC